MVFLEELLTPLASLLHVPVGVLVFATLMVMGVFGHFAIYRIVRRLTTAADRTETPHLAQGPTSIYLPINTLLAITAGLLARSSSPHAHDLVLRRAIHDGHMATGTATPS